MKFSDIKDYLKAKALSVTNVDSCKYGWIADVGEHIASGEVTFPCVYLQKPTEAKIKDGLSHFSMTYYLLGTGRNDDGEGGEMDDDEKEIQLDVLSDIWEDFHRAVLDNDNQMTEFGYKRISIIGDVVATRDDFLTNNSDVFISVKVKFAVTGPRC